MAQDIDPMTFEDLSSAYRVEMRSQILADARKDLYSALAGLQESVQKEYEAEYSKDPDSLMCEGMNERRKKVNNLVQKVIDLRMEKIAMMALRASMGAVNIIDKLTAEEREYYSSIADGSKKHRNLVLRSRSRRNYVIPNISPVAADDDAKAPAAAVIPGADLEESGPTERPDRTEGPQDELITIRILEDLPKIAGPDCDYDLRKENVVRMPATLANALINHEKAVKLNVTP
jgi:DNA replication factor GINS